MQRTFTIDMQPVTTAIWVGSSYVGDTSVHKKIASYASFYVLIFDAILSEHLVDLINALQPLILAVDGGEGCKTRDMKEQIEDFLIAHGVGADSVIIACGGGALLDLVGFVAATYCRGVPLCYFPTTLLAMVDAAIGGKNGINGHGIKNCIGALYHPKAVFVDLNFLQSLPQEEYKNGVVEILKLQLLGLVEYDADIYCSISKAIQAKMEIVCRSQKQPKIRDLLNFGHTVGHAYEALEAFSVPHGKAVALGMIAESYIAFQMGVLSKESFEKIKRTIEDTIPVTMKRGFLLSKWCDYMQQDKKNKNGVIHIVLLRDIAAPLEDQSVPVAMSHIEAALTWLQQEYVQS